MDVPLWKIAMGLAISLAVNLDWPTLAQHHLILKRKLNTWNQLLAGSGKFGFLDRLQRNLSSAQSSRHLMRLIHSARKFAVFPINVTRFLRSPR